MAVKALGTKLKVGKTTPVTVAKLTSISGLELSADTIDVTTHDNADGYREFIQGLKDAGEVGISGFLTPVVGSGQSELIALFESGEVEDFVIEFPAALKTKWEFKGIVTSITTSAELEDPVSFEGTIKVSGKPTLTVTP